MKLGTRKPILLKNCLKSKREIRAIVLRQQHLSFPCQYRKAKNFKNGVTLRLIKFCSMIKKQWE
jgi:hypothetical protein